MSDSSLLYALRLVRAGLKSGNVKSKPIISFGRNAESADMQSLEEIVDAALAKYELVPKARERAERKGRKATV